MKYKTVLIVIASLMLLMSSVMSQEMKRYISLAGEFYFEYPDSWEQIDSRVVDAFLKQSGAGRTTLQYDAAFCPAGSFPFYSGPYFILTVDTLGQLSQKEIDSVLQILQESYGKGVKYFPVADFTADMKSNTPVYDKEQKVVTIRSDIYDQNKFLKKHLLIMKFYEKGIASFYFYAPDSLFQTSSNVLHGILNTFTYGDIDKVLPRETLQVADLKDIGKKDTSSKVSRTIPYAVLVVIILIVVLRMKRRRKSS